MSMQPRHQLAALIQAVETANEWSDPEVAERAARRGHKISKSNISRMRLEPVVSIRGSAIQALAAGLGISPLDVADAALASMGIHRTTSAGDDVETAIRRDPALAASQRRMLLALLREMKGTEDEDQGETSTPDLAPTLGTPGTRRAPMKNADVAWLDDRRAPDVDEMLEKVAAEAARQDEAGEPLPYDPADLSAARGAGTHPELRGPSKGERLHRRIQEAGEESQDDGTEDPA